MKSDFKTVLDDIRENIDNLDLVLNSFRYCHSNIKEQAECMATGEQFALLAGAINMESLTNLLLVASDGLENTIAKLDQAVKTGYKLIAENSEAPGAI